MKTKRHTNRTRVALARVLFISAGTLILCSSCQKFKRDETQIRGQAINLTDRSPLSGYEVRLVETKTPMKPFSPLIMNIIESTTLSESGSFAFSAELNKRNRYGYTVEFDPGDLPFKSHNWQSGDYEEVVQKARISKEEFNDVTIKMVPNGSTLISAVNDEATGMTASFKATLRNHLDSNLSFSKKIESGQNVSNSVEVSFPAGEAEIVWEVSVDGEVFKEVLPITILHGETTKINYVFKP